MTSPGLAAKDEAGGVEFAVVVSAGSARAGVRGLHGDALKVAVHAPPERGKANEEVGEVVAAWLGIPVKRISIVMGQSSRRKRLRVAGLSVEEIKGRL